MKFFCRAIPVLTVAVGYVSAFVSLPASRQIACGSRRQAITAWTGASGVGARAAATSSRRLSMAIFEDVTAEMKASMKSGDKSKLEGLRMIRAAFLTETKAAGSGDTLPDEKCIAILRKMSKQQQESIDMYRKGKRDDLVEKEVKMQQLIDSKLPQLADEATTQKWVDEAIASADAKGPSDMGKVMGLLMKAHKTEMDGGLAQRLVSAQLKGGA
ncbi:unnamed protein product [Scytosiphon promiscuus]